MASVRSFALVLAMTLAAGWEGTAIGQRFPSVLPRGAPAISFNAERVLVRPSASLRSFVLAGLNVSDEERRFSVRCSLSRETGGVAVCDVPGRQGDIEQAVAEIAEHYRLQLDARMLGSPALLVVIIPERISASDVRSATSNGPTVPFSQVNFERRAAAEELGEMYPRHLGRSGLSPSVRLDCEILPDLTLLCVDPQVTGVDPSDAAFRAFQLAGLQASGLFRSSAALVSGSAAPGHRFRMTFQFQPPPYKQ